MTHGPCDACEELLQGYLDRQLTDAEVSQAESHLDSCDYCRRRYRFEASLRQYVQTTAAERSCVSFAISSGGMRSAAVVCTYWRSAASKRYRRRQ